MIFRDAATFPMPFGKRKGETLDAIASDDAGLLYLDYMRGMLDEAERKGTSSGGGPTLDALRTYLDDPGIAGFLMGAMERRR